MVASHRLFQRNPPALIAQNEPMTFSDSISCPVRHPLLEDMGADYPSYIEHRHPHILEKVDALWDSPAIDDYLGDLLIDKRGGRRGFAPEAIKEINALREFRQRETLRAAESAAAAAQELQERGIPFTRAGFLGAVEAGDRAAVDLFVRSNFNIHTIDDNGTPPLLYALKKGYTIIARILLNAGAEVNEKDRLGLLPLMVCCGKPTLGYKDVAEGLIKRGAHINVRDALGYTPLLLALSGGTIGIAELLIERGADLTARTRKNETALTLAEQATRPDIITLLLSKGAPR